jgi:V8-like Glu-specific endopeptidase
VVWGTGFLIDNNHLITAGHCVYDHDGRFHAKQVKVYIGYEGQNVVPESQVRYANHIALGGNFYSAHHKDNDLAIITLNRAFGDSTGTGMGFKYHIDIMRNMNIAGYPAKLPKSPKDMRGKIMYSALSSGEKRYQSEAMLTYKIPTSAGKFKGNYHNVE